MNIVVSEFRLGDVEDPQIYAAQPLWEWQQSEMGKWVMDNALDQPSWTTAVDYSSYGYKVSITANLKEEDVTYYTLKWGTKTY